MTTGFFFHAMILLCWFPSLSCGATYYDSQLRKALLGNYTEGRPVANPQDTLEVSLAFSLFQIKELDGKRQILSTFGQVIMAWTDETLQWDPALYGGQSETNLPTNSIWTPVLGVRNSATDAIDSDWADVWPLIIYADGTVVYAPTGSFDTACDLNMLAFPFDVQRCHIDFGSFLHTENVINVVPMGPMINMDFYTANKEFKVDLNETSLKRITLQMSYLPADANRVPMIRITIPLHRKYYYYVMYILLPTIVLSVVSLVIFAIPVDSGEKLGVGITILLSYSVFMLILADKTPQTSENIPVLAIYLTSVICLTAVALFCSAIVIRIHHTVPPRPLPNWLRSCVLRGLGGLFCKNEVEDCKKKGRDELDLTDHDDSLDKTQSQALTAEDQSPLLSEILKVTGKMEEDAETEQLQDQWKMVARIIDKFFLVVFSFINIMLIIVLFAIVPYV